MRIKVIGAGVIGLFCARSLQQDGHEVIVSDRGNIGTDKCSLGNSGIIVPSHFVPLAAPGMVSTGLKLLGDRKSPFRIKPTLDPALARWCLLFSKSCTRAHVDTTARVLCDLHLASKQLYLDFAAESGYSFGLQSRGLHLVCETQQRFEEEIEVGEMGQKLGLSVSVSRGGMELNGVEIMAHGSVHYADDCHLDPGRLLDCLFQDLQARGVEFEWGAESRFEGADGYVLACGAMSGQVGKSLGLDIPVQPGKGLSYTVEPPQSPDAPMIFCEARVAVTPMGRGLRFGGTMELGEWSFSVDHLRLQGMVKSVGRCIPAYSQMNRGPAWAGLRPCSPDGLPYIGPTSRPNIWVATGHGMMGVSLAPVTGQLIAAAVRGEPVDTSLLPERFAKRGHGTIKQS